MKRPAPIVMGAVLMFARVLSGAIAIALVLRDVPAFVHNTLLNGATPEEIDLLPSDQAILDELVRYGAIGYAIWLTFYLVLGWLVLRGINWARITAMLLATISILVPFIDWWRSGLDITLRTTLLSLALDILILLALSSRAARAYARRNEVVVRENSLVE